MSYAIAIDGPAGAGKSTVARHLARELQFLYVDTGALYRAIGYRMLRAGIDPADAAAVAAALPETAVSLHYVEGEQRVFLGEEDVSGAIRTPEVSMAASAVSAIPAVRQFLLQVQRDMAAQYSVIMDGRDIGTTILPRADVKIFLTASPSCRRRAWIPPMRRCWRIWKSGITMTPTGRRRLCAVLPTPCWWIPATTIWRAPSAG